jgi:hypothetical protein
MAAGEAQLTDHPRQAVTGLGADQDEMTPRAGTRPAGGTTAVLPLPGAGLVYEVTGDGPAVNELLTRFLAGLAVPAPEGVTGRTAGLTGPAEGLTGQGDGRLFDQAVTVGSPATDVLAETAGRLQIWLSVGAADLPADLPGRAPLYNDPAGPGDGGEGDRDDWLSRGNSRIIGPGGEVLAGPLIGEEGVLYAEIDAGQARAARQEFDPVGHYGRSDVLRLVVDTTPRSAVSFGRRDEASERRPTGRAGWTDASAQNSE